MDLRWPASAPRSPPFSASASASPSSAPGRRRSTRAGSTVSMRAAWTTRTSGRKIPLLTKEDLRKIAPKDFHAQFIQPQAAVVEYWRSGGSTGRPLFYPRSAEDIEHSLLCFRRGLAVTGATCDDLVHISFPLGIHPVAHLYARAAEQCGIGTVWCGAGTNTASTCSCSSSTSFGPPSGPAWRATATWRSRRSEGFDLAKGSVTKIVVAAEPLSKAKRAKLERMWGAEVFDQFGMTEGALMACEGAARTGSHLWSDCSIARSWTR